MTNFSCQKGAKSPSAFLWSFASVSNGKQRTVKVKANIQSRQICFFLSTTTLEKIHEIVENNREDDAAFGPRILGSSRDYLHSPLWGFSQTLLQTGAAA